MGAALSQLLGWLIRPPQNTPGTATDQEVSLVVDTVREENRVTGIRGDDAKARELEAIRNFLAMKRKDRENYPLPSYLAPHQNDINVALTGEAGTGKSSLMNVLLGTSQARTGVVECTMAPRRYDIQADGALAGKVHFWDLPGVGTMNFPADRYIREMGMRYYDIVVLVTFNRIMQSNVEVVKELDRYKVPVVVVVNKMDDIVESAADDEGWDEDETFGYIRQQHVENFSRNGCPDVKLFLLSTRCIKKQPINASMNREWERFRESLMMAVKDGRSYDAPADLATI
ncbi:hypothetical protein BSKO_13854 [Bryopsis sp. KO-2023]|nr:hypothetical protein BSKO_13854 [Bryopsis sp. KO-2023]